MSNGGRPDPYQAHSNVAITPRARSRSNAGALAAAKYSASIVSGIAEYARRVNGAAGISHRPITRENTG
jgi:hypothetical protein